MGERIERIARAICQETCAFYGDPPCWRMAEMEGEVWTGQGCDEPGCMALAKAAVATDGGPDA